MSWLRDRWEELTAQVKMGDNKTASTVRAARQTPPAQIPTQQTQEWKIKNAKYGVLANNKNAQNQLLNDTKAAPKQSLWQQGTGFVKDTLDANTQADQQRRMSQGLPRYYQDQSISSRISRAAETGGRIAARAIQGIGQDAGGAYDLLSPGHGVNRFTKMYTDRGAQTDKEVQDMGLDPNVYKAGQVPVAGASYFLPGKVISNVGKVPRVMRASTTASNIINKVPGVARATGFVDDLAANGTRLQRVAGKMAQSYRQPGAIADIGVDALQNAGHRTSLGQDNSLTTAGLDVGMSLGMQGGMNLLGQGAGAAAQIANRGVIKPTTNLVRKTVDVVAPVQTTTKLVKRTSRMNIDTQDALRAYSDMLVGADPDIQGKVASDLIARVRQIGSDYNVDLTNGSVVDRMDRIEAMLNGYLPQTQTGRRLAIPEVSADYDPKYSDALESLKAEARKYKSIPKPERPGRTAIQRNLSEALKNGTDKPVSFGRLSKKKFYQINAVRQSNGLPPLDSNELHIYPSVVRKLQDKRIDVGNMTPDEVADIAYSAVHNTKSRVLPSKYPQAQAIVKPRESLSNVAYVGKHPPEVGGASVKSVYKQRNSQLKNTPSKIAPNGRSVKGTKTNITNKTTPVNPTPFQKDLQTAGLAPKTKGATTQKALETTVPAQNTADTAIRAGQETPRTTPKPKRTGSVGKETPATKAPRVQKQKAEPSVQSLKNDTTNIKVTQRGGTKKVTVGKITLPDDLVGDVNQWKDVGSTLKTMDRNIEAAAPSDAQYRKIHDFAIEPRGRAVTAMVDETASIKAELKDVVKQYGLKDKKVRADVMRFGEKKIKYSELVEKYGKQKADNIKEADKWFRAQYDRLLEETNAVLRKFNQPEIPKRANYYTHFQDDNLWASVGLKIKQIGQRGDVLQETGGQAIRGRGIDPKLLGQSEYTTPNKKWNPFAQQRKGDQTKYDAVEAFERYLLPTLHNKHLTESVVKTRMVTKAFQDATADTKHLPTFIRQLQEYGNNLAGKTNRFDRPLLETKWGSRALSTTRYMQQQMGRNTILGSVRSAVMQTAALPLSIKEAGLKNTALGLMEEIGGKITKKDAANVSDFLRRRYADMDSVLPSKIRKAENAAGYVFEQIEQTTTKAIWRATHRQALEKGLSGRAAIKEADRITERLVGGRQVGERAEAFRSVLGNTAMQFQLEVNNFMQEVARDAGNKDVKKLLKLFAATYAFNTLVYEPVFGDKPLPDPVDAAKESFENLANGNIAGAVGRMPAEVLSNVPGGSLAAGLYPEYGARVGGVKLPGRKELFGDTEAGRYGGSLAALGVLQNPEYLIPKSFGLKQVDRTIGGVRDWMQGENKSNKGKQRFEIEQSIPNALKAGLFGSYGTSEGKAYLKEQSAKLRGVDTGNKDSELKQIGATTSKDEKGNYTTRDKYDTIINAYYKNKDGSIKVNDYDTNQLRNTIKDLTSEYNSKLKSAGLREIKGDSRHAIDYAKFVKSIEGKDELEVERKTKTFFRKTYINQMDKRTQAFYGLSDAQMRNAINNGKVTKEQLAKAIETDNYLTEKGLQSYLQIGKTLRRALGIAVPGGSGGSGRGRGGGRKGSKKGKFDYSKDLFASSVTSGTVSKSLRSILERAMNG